MLITEAIPRAHPKLRIILLASGCALLALLYYPVLAGLIVQYVEDANYRYCVLIPLVSLYMLWRIRASLGTIPRRGGTLVGLAIIFLSAGLLIGGTAASELFTSRLSLPLLILGTTLFLRGSEFTRKSAFPLLFLLLMIPLPYIIYYKITFPLQILSAQLSAGLLEILRVSVIRKGNILLLPGYTLEVVAACSGLRSLMTMFTLALIFAAFSALSTRRRLILAACAVPAAIAANTVRLVSTALGAYAIGPEFADGILHEISGLIVFLSGFLLLLLCVGILRWKK
ncbi:MAG: exosortase/archaeosortase family protein [Candidatus Krumholzibacteriota bacterium]|nr:exosortase/archaeosortase family protein [Candidatus Krumholzibacteriota bacterium]